MEENDQRIRGSLLDDAIVRLHTDGENVHQAIGRTARMPWIDGYNPALVTEVPRGRVPLARGETAPLPRLDAAGVAAILNFELELSTYETTMVIITEPAPPPASRVETQRLWPTLRAAGYRVGPTLAPIGPYFAPRRVLADRTGVHPRTVHRICSGAQKMIPIDTAITILEELPPGRLLAELETERTRWETAMHFHHYDRFEYLEKLNMLAPALLQGANKMVLTATEHRALDELRMFLREADRQPSTDEHVPSAEQRLSAAEQWFHETLGRPPTSLSSRLKRHASIMFTQEQRAAGARKRALHNGVPDRVITTKAVYSRTNRLKADGRIRAGSKPRTFQPPPDYHDIVSCRAAEQQPPGTSSRDIVD